MNCQECQAHFDALLSNQLDTTRRDAVEQHCRECPACANALAAERKLWELLGAVEQRGPSHGFAERVLRQLDAGPERVTNGWRAWLRLPRLAFATASLVAVVAAGSVLVVRHVETQREKQLAAHFEDLFSVAQADDPDAILLTATYQNGDAL